MFPNTNNVTFQKQNKTKTTPFSPPPQTKPLNQRDLHKECKMFPSAVAAYVSVMVQRDISSNYILENWLEKPKNWLEKPNKNRNSTKTRMEIQQLSV